MPTDYKTIAEELTETVGKLGIKKGEIQQVFDKHGDSAKVKAALDAVDKMVAALSKLVMETSVTEDERKRKIAELKSKIQLLEIIRTTDPDFNHRIEAERELSVALATQSAWMEKEVLRFGDLLSEDGPALKVMLEQAGKEIAARSDLARVLKGVEIVLRVGAFSGAVAAKLAIAAGV